MVLADTTSGSSNSSLGTTSKKRASTDLNSTLMGKNEVVSISRLTVGLLGALLFFAVGCKALKLEQAAIQSEDDWLTEGDSGERRHATATAIVPPLEEVWEYNAGAGFGPGSPLILGDAVLVATRKGEMHAINFETGKRLGIEGFGDVLEGTPLIQGGTLLVPVRWGRRALLAYDLRRGQTRWRIKGEPIQTGLLAVDDGFIAVDAASWVRKYDVDTGAVIWEQNLGDKLTVHATPVLTQGHVVVADDRGRVVALHPQDGAVQWVRDLQKPVYASIAADEESLYIPTTRGQFFALDAARGEVVWQMTLPDTTVHFNTPAVDDGLVVVGASDGFLRAFDASSGDLLWTFEDDAALRSTPLLTPTMVYIGSMRRALFAIDRTTGALQWEHELRGRVKSAFAARDGHLVVLAEPRFVYLFKSASARDVVSP